MIEPHDYGFRIVGTVSEERRIIQWSAAFLGHAALDPRSEPHREAYLSAFQFGDDFRTHLNQTGSPKAFSGACSAVWMWFDIDREDLAEAQQDALRLTSALLERYALDESELLLFFSGSKGFHVGLPTELWQPSPLDQFHRVARAFAEARGNEARVRIDAGIYDKIRAFRAPNSRHPKTGLHKRRISFDELAGLSVERIQTLAQQPAEFEIPCSDVQSSQAKSDWQTALDAVQRQAALSVRPRGADVGGMLNRATLEFIRGGASTGDRHRMLFSAAANLAEYGCPPALAHALLTEAALDTGLPPSEVRRQIECGLNHKRWEGGYHD